MKFALPALALAAVLAAGQPAHAQWSPPIGTPQVVVAFDPLAGETPESVVVDRDGTLYISLALTGEIRKIYPDGTQESLAFLPLGVALPGAPLPGIMGALALGGDGTVYASLASADPDALGVWAVAPDGTATQLASLPPGALPNGIALRLGFLYVADAALGVIWRVPASGGAAEVYIDDPALLQVPGPIDIAPGANGLQFFGGELYVCNSSAWSIYAYPLDWRGRPGPRRLHAADVPCDDFAFDLLGNLYATTDPFNTLIFVRPDGSSEIVLTAEDGLDGPTSAAFGRTLGDFRTLYVTNAAFPFFSTTFTPSVMAIRVPIPGAPRWPF